LIMNIVSPTIARRAPALLATLSLMGAGSAVADSYTHYGEPVAFGAGSARTYLVQDAAGAPLSLGIELSERVLADLPHEMLVTPLAFPGAAGITQYTFAMLDWMPHGHEPEGGYTLPHFDFHFHMTPQVRVEAIPGGPDPVVIDPALVPENFISPGNMAIPGMGVHWVDASASELNGERFTQTFLYGASGGELTFLEPMVTLDFLAQQPDFSAPVPQPRAVQRDGYYPQRYSVRYLPDERVLRISLDELTHRTASPSPLKVSAR
jgi:hypothetical protein